MCALFFCFTLQIIQFNLIVFVDILIGWISLARLNWQMYVTERHMQVVFGCLLAIQAAANDEERTMHLDE